MIGQSGITPFKELCFQELLEALMTSARYKINAAEKYGKRPLFHVYDLYAGTGVNRYGDGSIRIIYNKLNCIGGLSGKYALTGVEKNKGNFKELSANLSDIRETITLKRSSAADAITAIPNDIKNIHGEMLKHACGVVFLDPNGVVKAPEYKAICQAMSICKGVDIVVNMSVTQLHRNRGVKSIKGFQVYNHIGKVQNWKRDTGRKHVYVRDILKGGRHKWSIVVLTNNSLKGIKGPLRDCGFYNMRTARGRSTVARIDYNQLSLFKGIHS